jgi:Family of unknown function (DUF5677)
MQKTTRVTAQMGRLHEEFMQFIAEQVSGPSLVRAALDMALDSRGIKLESAETDVLAERLFVAMDTETELEHLEIFSVVSGLVSISLEDLHSALEEVYRIGLNKIPELIDDVVNDQVETRLAALRAPDREEVLSQSLEVERDFQQRLYERWKSPLDLLRVSVEVALVYGQQFSENSSVESKEESDLRDCLFFLHVRACRLAREIESLLRSGWVDGAMARWRALHEATITAVFISKFKGDLPTRYLSHGAIDRLRGAEDYQRSFTALNHEPIEPAEVEQLRAQREELVKMYGSAFARPNGWAADIIGSLGGNANRVTFAELERRVDLEHWRPYYGFASHRIHPSPHGLFLSLGLPNDGLSAGPSNWGLVEPGQVTCISFALIEATYLTSLPSIDNLVAAKVVAALAQDAQMAFVSVYEEFAAEIGHRQ